MNNKNNKNDEKLLVERTNKALKLFNEYLGSTFYKLTPSDKGGNIYELRSKEKLHLVKIDEDDDTYYVPIDMLTQRSSYSVYLLLMLIKNQIINEDIDKRSKIETEFWFAGLPFNFQIEGFVKRYLGKTSAIRLKDLLHLMGIKEKTYGSYFSRGPVKFNDADLPELIADIFDRTDKNTLTVFKVQTGLGIDQQYLIDYIQDVQGQFILTDNNTKILYQKPIE